MIEVLAYRLLTEPALHETVVKNRARLKWAAAHSNEGMWDVIDTTVLYDEKYDKLPGRKALWEFVETSDDPIVSRRAEAIRLDLASLKDVTEEARAQFTDISVLVDNMVTEARKLWHADMYHSAQIKVLQGAAATKGAKVKDPVGADETWAWVNKMMATDLSEEDRTGGAWHENMGAVERRMDG